MKEIALTKGHVAIVDDEDFECLSKFSWHYSGGYALRRTSVKEHRPSIIVRMHRQIVSADHSMEVDHINGNKLDNRKENLRQCSHRQNGMNGPKKKCNLSGFKGVTFDKKLSKWRAQISNMGKTIFIGSFLTPESAHEAYKIKAVELFGQFALFD